MPQPLNKLWLGLIFSRRMMGGGETLHERWTRVQSPCMQKGLDGLLHSPDTATIKAVTMSHVTARDKYLLGWG